MKKDMPLEGLRWSRDSGSALYDTPQTAVLGGGNFCILDFLNYIKNRVRAHMRSTCVCIL